MKKILILSLTILSFVLFFGVYLPAVSLAAGGVEHIFNDVFQPLAIALVTILTLLVLAYIIRFIAAKTGIQIGDAVWKKAEPMAVNAALAVEEKAMDLVKSKAVAWTSKQKLGEAVARLLELVPAVTPQQADTFIHAALAKIPGLGATEEKGLSSAGPQVVTINKAGGAN